MGNSRLLYDIEAQIKDFHDELKLARRQSLSRHVLDQIDEYLSSAAMSPAKVLPKSNVGIAASYVRRHWTALTEFIGDSSNPIDNNDCEQLMKRVATGRKNWLFKGSLAAGERAANLMTIIGSPLRYDLDVHAYMDEVLRRVLAGETDWDALSPPAWKTELIDARLSRRRAPPSCRPQTHSPRPPKTAKMVNPQKRLVLVYGYYSPVARVPFKRLAITQCIATRKLL